MLSLYWKHGEQTRSLIKKPFESESDLEAYISANQDILGDIYVIYRQIRTGQKQDIPDMLGVDQDARICIIELKNERADESILPQALGYAIWAETNPDSIKAIWLESERKPEEIEVDWDNLDIRVVLIAPAFKDTVPRMAGKIGYDIDLMEVRRYGFEDDEFLALELFEKVKPPAVKTTKPRGDWDWVFYESEHGKEATDQFRQAVDALAALVERRGWDTPYNLNKYYTGFKLGNKLVFLVHWGGTYAWKVVLKIPEDLAATFHGSDWEFQNYDDSFHQAVFRPLHPEEPDITELEPLLVEAYKHISGSK
jgi:hypothetical protein